MTVASDRKDVRIKSIPRCNNHLVVKSYVRSINIRIGHVRIAHVGQNLIINNSKERAGEFYRLMSI